MPLDVEIRLNHQLIETVWIARLDQYQGIDHFHAYSVGIGTRSEPPWSDRQRRLRAKRGEPEPDYPRFFHRYEDGARKCLQLALAALEEAGL